MDARITILFGVLAAALAGCAGRQFEAEVTRFHDGRVEAIANRTVSIEPARSELGPGDFGRYARMVGRELRRLGFRPAGDARPDLIGRLDYAVAPVSRSSTVPPSAAPATGGGPGDSGAGAAVPAAGPDARYARRLSLKLIDSTSRTTLWEARAVSIGRVADLDLAVPFLARALLETFPGAAGESVTVAIPVSETGEPPSREANQASEAAPANGAA